MRRRYRVEGTVQGVGFRYFVQRHAIRLGLVGWVRNSHDGSVETEAGGDAIRLAQFEAELRRGPASATVTNLRVEEVVDEGEAHRAFEIRG